MADKKTLKCDYENCVIEFESAWEGWKSVENPDLQFCSYHHKKDVREHCKHDESQICFDTVKSSMGSSFLELEKSCGNCGAKLGFCSLNPWTLDFKEKDEREEK
jgi:hypothetical protein